MIIVWLGKAHSFNYMWDPYLRSDHLRLAFVFRRYSDNIYDISEFDVKDCLTITSLCWKSRMSPGRDDPIYIKTHL